MKILWNLVRAGVGLLVCAATVLVIYVPWVLLMEVLK